MMTFDNVILRVAKTHLTTKLKQTSIAALGVTFGIASYITLVCFMTGLNKMLDDLILNRTPHVHVYNEIKPSKVQPVDFFYRTEKANNLVRSVKPRNTSRAIHNGFPIIDFLKSKEDVKGVTPQVETQIFYLSGSIELGGNLQGINIMDEDALFNFGDYLVEGSTIDLDNSSNGILLGIGVAEKMSVAVGDRIQISNIKGEIYPMKIVGIYQSGLAELDAVLSYAKFGMVQRIMGEAENFVTDINVKLIDIKNAIPLAKTIEKNFNVTAVDIQTANAQFETGTKIRNIITYAVSITLLIVAGFGIYNILNMLIYEKMNDIAILKATGFSGRDVQRIFMSQAMIIGLLGGLLGLFLGYLLAVFIDTLPFNTEALPTIETYPVNINPLYFIIGFSFAIFSTFLAGYFPARKARKIDPVSIIRGQ